jgi:pimeloyl-ACP methyl ester carboxylesterase
VALSRRSRSRSWRRCRPVLAVVAAVALMVCAGCGEDDSGFTAAAQNPESGLDQVVETTVSVPGSIPPANPVTGSDTPAALDRGLADVYELPGTSDTAVTKVLVLVPGFLGGANTFDYMARRIVLRTAGRTAVWAEDRRSNLLEDQTGLDAAEAAKDADVAKNYYFHGAAVGDKHFAGFLSGSAVSFESEWGIKTQVEDLDALISAAIARYPHATVFLGGHSLGGSIVPIYAAWDFGDHAGFQRLSGLLLFEGTPDPQPAGGIPSQAAYETTGTAGPLGGSSLAALRSGNPVVSLEPFVGTDLFVTAQIIGMRASDLFGAPQALSPDADLNRGFTKLLFGLQKVPVATNRAALGFGFDDNYEPLSFARVSIGSAVGPVGPNRQQALFSAFLSPGDMLLAPTDATATYDWQRASESGGTDPTDVEVFARTLFEGPSDFIEWYFPARLTLDVGVTSDLNVQPSGDWRKDVYGMAVTENARVDLPVFAVAATRGLVRDVANFDPYCGSIASLLRNGVARAAVADGCLKISKAGYVHLDVLTATDTGPGNGIFGPMVAWMDRAVRLAPPPSASGLRK